MNNDRVYYIQPTSYIHHLSKNTIIDRFMKSSLCNDLIDKEKQYILADLLYIQFSKEGNVFFPPTKEIYENDIYISQKIMYHLKEYFLLSTKQPKTKKISWALGRFTRKKRS